MCIQQCCDPALRFQFVAVFLGGRLAVAFARFWREGRARGSSRQVKPPFVHLALFF